ncbi:baseplate J/gp47 family protein [Zymobacter palmae]|uniref:Uncharacterized homolog of phage Mu protein gp47 n=1 Tax=Zymobacter palmae TaxID=33074 RepID=A0A348HFQ7_9GAMM|nr:baseplate J/gp47 family protein [Zymobacter palmae]BBG30459.1 uncharacterized homolog of phage Mu protein gp47 [Zymobacter palmae]
MSTTNVPAVTFSTAGVSVPSETDILNGLLSDIDSAFGGGTNKDLTTPQGQLAQSLAAIIGHVNNNAAWMANNLDPDVASGRMQDAIGRIYYLDRNPGSGTVVTATCRGRVNTVIPAGSLAQDANGYIYASTHASTIPRSGQVDIQFQCQTIGPVACPAGNLSRIYRNIDGWESITNAAAGTEGAYTESRSAFELRRKESVAINSRSTTHAIRARLLSTTGVVDAYVWDNTDNKTAEHGETKYPVPSGSQYICVAGGNAADIAAAIFKSRNTGTPMVGDTEYTVEDDQYLDPRPKYTMRWVTAKAAPVYFKVTIAKNNRIPGNFEELIREKIVDAFYGTDGTSRARIGSRILPGKFYGPVSDIDTSIEVQSITIGFDHNADKTSITAGADQRPTIETANITVEAV